MNFSKKELSFLDLYAVCVDNRSRLGDKLFCVPKKNENKVYFSQSSSDITLITWFNKPDIEETNVCVFPTSTLNSLLKLIPETETIKLSSESVSFKSGSTYKFDLLKYKFNNFLDYFKAIEDTQNQKTVHVEDLNKLSAVKNFIGDKGLDAVGIFDSYFIASNKTRILGAVKTKNENVSNIFIPKVLFSIFNQLKLNSVDLIQYKEEFIFFSHENNYLIVPIKKYNLPNVLKPEQRSFYDHPFKIVVDRTAFLLALQRIDIFTKTNYYNRVFITVEKNNLILENKDSTYAKEILSATVDENLIGTTLIVSTNYVSNTLSLFSEKEVILKLLPDKKAVAMSIWGEEKFYVHLLYVQK